MISIVPYTSTHETGWVHCRVLSFLNTAYYNDVVRSKPNYNNPTIELVALVENSVVGILDVEIESAPKEICSSENFRSGMIQHIAILPEHQRKNIGQMMLHKAEDELILCGIPRIEAWTRDDQWVRNWYIKNDFKSFYSYLHITVDGNYLVPKEPIPKLNVISGFAHYTGDNFEGMQKKFPKNHECIGFEKLL